jgi:hypothetical protein
MNAKLILGLLIATLPLAALALDRKDAELAMTEAGAAVDAAQQADAAQYDAVDFNTSHDMLVNAQAAYDHHHWTESVINAENAKVDADLATARSRQHRAEQATAQVELSVRTLREQLGISGDGP